jgi:hypothetical protein
MEYAACHGGKEKSIAVLERYLRDAPDYFLAGYKESLQKYRQDGLPGAEHHRWDAFRRADGLRCLGAGFGVDGVDTEALRDLGGCAHFPHLSQGKAPKLAELAQWVVRG